MSSRLNPTGGPLAMRFAAGVVLRRTGRDRCEATPSAISEGEVVEVASSCSVSRPTFSRATRMAFPP